MIERLMAPGVCAVDMFEDVTGPGDLYPAESALIANAVVTRRREFITARWCARRALAGLGQPATPILPGRHGMPGWPAEVVGSITHCAGFRAAAAARTSEVLALGIDAEPNAPVPERFLEQIALPGELRHVRDLLRVAPEVRWDRLLFSAKEAVYKTWYPWTGQRLRFEDAALSFDRKEGSFTALVRPQSASSPQPSFRRLDGRWLAERGLLLCAITVTTAAAADTPSSGGRNARDPILVDASKSE
ncbi:4'-phosphopantetheinyl transferase [Streptomyces sp. NPDC102437]|uniref:4'-phosphopantetheinyl transferase family protein n=1 Tax=Streptomyces sp. NPDC102437 TaxID=3366175 RepID=UPI003809F1F5